MFYDNATSRLPQDVGVDGVLKACRESISSQRDYMVRMQGEWLTQVLFCHGVQNANVDVVSGSVELSGQSGENSWWPGYNVIDSVVNRLRSTLMQQSPQREARSVITTELGMEQARIAKLVMDWAYEYHCFEDLEQEAGDWFLKTGQFIASFYYDASKGEVIGTDEMGNEVHAGELVPRIDPPSRWYFDPRASNMRDVRFATRMTLQTIEWVEERWPDKVNALMGSQTTLTGNDFLERRLLNLTQASHSQSTLNLSHDKRCVSIFEFYEVPCAKYPKGRHAILAGSGTSPDVVLQEWAENFYGCIPAVLVPLSRVPGRLFGETPIKFLLPPQREINRRRRQIIKNCDLIGNPTILVPMAGGSPPQGWTNAVGQQRFFDPQVGPPIPFVVPALPNFVLESEAAAMRMIEYMSPTSPGDMAAAQETTSGIQLSLLEEIKRRALMPMMRSWELGWDNVWKMYVKLWRKFTIFPRQVRAAGPEAQMLSEYVSGDMVSEDVLIRVVPYSSLPSSRTAAFAEWMEMFKTGAANPADPMTMKRFLEDTGRGDMARTYRDFTADMDVAERNLLRIITKGELVVPRVQDNVDVHLMKFTDFMKTAEYETLLKTDPMLEKRLSDAIKIFGLAKQAQERAIILDGMRIGAIAGAAGGIPSGSWEDASKMSQKAHQNAVQAQAKGIAPGNPMGGAEPQATKGFGNAAHPNADQGGPR